MASNHQIDTLIRAYLAAQEEKKAAEATYNEIRDELMGVLDSENLQRYTGAFGKITICERKNYNYPDEIVVQQEMLKAAEKAAQKTGTATIASVTRFPRVTVTE